ncbi:hypothetical protein pdam_00020515 [Pocillopora damicornis]|uniref:Uncharacterized protein n=1 Tax=Pocillopora damicornis TaxID=46731 RepID=A0A3M6TZ12_POCDA|nr:hypothetical protein pdam_00020515 [Pocillopora damicornis]
MLFVRELEPKLNNHSDSIRARRFVDKTPSKIPDVSSASVFLFIKELENNDRLPFLRMMIIRNSPRPDTKVYAKPTDTGILPRCQSYDETAI